ncbi:MAG: hypothetical protein ACI4BG_00895 [Prevotella sp.]
MVRIFHIISFLFFLCLLPISVYSQDSLKTTKDSVAREIQMKEFVVTGDNIINRGNHQLLLLTNENRKFGTNALEAVSSMRFFYQQLNATSLLSYDRKEVLILINGVPSTAMDLRGFKASDIKYVEYYNVTPPKFMALTSGPVANIVMKRRHDQLYTAYANTFNSFTTGYGSNQLNLAYTDSLNQVRVNYSNKYRNIHHIESIFEDAIGNASKTLYSGDRQKYMDFYNGVQVSYQRFQGPHLLNVKLGYDFEPRHQYSPTNLKEYVGSEVFSGHRDDTLSSRSNSYVVDLFYQLTLPKKRSLAFNVVNTFSHSRSDNMIFESFDGLERDYYVANRIRNRVYSLIANATYHSPLAGGSFSVGAWYNGAFLRQKAAGAVYRPETHNLFLYSGIFWSVKRVSLYPSVGVHYIHQTSAERNRSYTAPYVRFYTDWWPEKMKGFSVQLTLQMQVDYPALNLLTSSQTAKTFNFYTTGNPNLKQNLYYNAKLTVAYFKPQSQDYIYLQYLPGYYHSTFSSSVLSVDGSRAIMRPDMIDKLFYNHWQLYAKKRIGKWFSVTPYATYSYKGYDTPSQKVHLSYIRYGGSLNFMYDKFTIEAGANSPTKSRMGDLTVKGSAQYFVDVMYKNKAWSLGMRWNYSGKGETTTGSIPGFQYREESTWKPLKSMFSLTATWSFSRGRSRQHPSKSLNNSYDDDGLNQYNRPEAAQ